MMTLELSKVLYCCCRLDLKQAPTGHGSDFFNPYITALLHICRSQPGWAGQAQHNRFFISLIITSSAHSTVHLQIRTKTGLELSASVTLRTALK